MIFMSETLEPIFHPNVLAQIADLESQIQEQATVYTTISAAMAKLVSERHHRMVDSVIIFDTDLQAELPDVSPDRLDQTIHQGMMEYVYMLSAAKDGSNNDEIDTKIEDVFRSMGHRGILHIEIAHGVSKGLDICANKIIEDGNRQVARVKSWYTPNDNWF
jgi:hypothetical protein